MGTSKNKTEQRVLVRIVIGASVVLGLTAVMWLCDLVATWIGFSAALIAITLFLWAKFLLLRKK